MGNKNKQILMEENKMKIKEKMMGFMMKKMMKKMPKMMEKCMGGMNPEDIEKMKEKMHMKSEFLSSL